MLLKKQIIADRAMLTSLSSAHEQELNDYVLLVENKQNDINNLQEMLNERIATADPVSTDTVLQEAGSDRPGELLFNTTNRVGSNGHNTSKNNNLTSNNHINKCWACNDALFGYVVPCATCHKEYHSICIKKNQANAYVCNTCMT